MLREQIDFLRVKVSDGVSHETPMETIVSGARIAT